MLAGGSLGVYWLKPIAFYISECLTSRIPVGWDDFLSFLPAPVIFLVELLLGISLSFFFWVKEIFVITVSSFLLEVYEDPSPETKYFEKFWS